MWIVVAWTAAACGAGGTSSGEDATASAPANGTATAADNSTDSFVDRAAATGLDFVHFNGASGRFHYPELIPPGVALFDYDNDGDLDIYLVQGRMLHPDDTPADAVRPPMPNQPPLMGRLYRNELSGGAVLDPASLRFTDVTAQSGITADGYGLGVAAADVNNDGWTDLFLTNYGLDALYLNNGDGTFTDATAQTGIGPGDGFGVSAAFVDYDRDGWLDLYVGDNVDYTIDNGIQCGNLADSRDYCPPDTYGGTTDRLYRNAGAAVEPDGNGPARFVDVTETALPGARFGPALGVSTADLNGDGWTDIYVANDGAENLLWFNQRDGTFRDEALLAGVALSGLGATEASMGVDAGDYDNDGDDDLFMTHLTGEGHNLYDNDGTGAFEDRSIVSGLGAGSLPYTGWGTTWFDYDNDGWLDLLTVNGTILALAGREGGMNSHFPYDQQKTLFRNNADGTFTDVTAQAGAVFALSEAGRGAAFGDIDNDGDMDVLIGNDAGPVRLLINQLRDGTHWIGLSLVGGAEVGARPMIGARVEVQRSGEPTLHRRARSDGSYASANDPRVLVGLGDSATPPTATVHWPDGSTENFSSLAVDQWQILRQGSGE